MFGKEGKAKSINAGSAAGILSAVIIMFFTARWILSQKAEYEWISEGTIRLFCYLFAVAGTVVLSWFITVVGKKLKEERLFPYPVSCDRDGLYACYAPFYRAG